jgi:membrane carboxypeptidase/penicillin-binding protein
MKSVKPDQTQLELYLNATYFGTEASKPIHGIAAAAEAYFQKSHLALSNEEFMALIGMTISPNTLQPGTQNSQKRVTRIKAFLERKVQPASVLDVEYAGKTTGTFSEEVLMSVLRLITHAKPSAVGASEYVQQKRSHT